MQKLGADGLKMPLLDLAPKGPCDLMSPAGLRTKGPPEYVSPLPRDPDRAQSGLLEEECDMCRLKEI